MGFFRDRFCENGRKTGGDVLAVPAEQHGDMRTSTSTTKLESNRAVISSRLAGASHVSFALFSAIKARKLQAPIFARQLACTVTQGELVLTQADQPKIRWHCCGDASRLAGASRVTFALCSAIKARNFRRLSLRGS